MMKKLIFLFFMLTLYVGFPTRAMSEFYVIRLKNGGSLATPLYWSESGQVYFFYAGGTVGVEKQVIERVEKHQGERNFLGSSTSVTTETKELPPLSSTTEKSPGSEKPPVAKIPEEKVNIADYKNKKDRLTVELENLLDKRREAGQRKDQEAREKLTTEIRNTSSEIYGITDEVTAKNKGKLPEGWWVK